MPWVPMAREQLVELITDALGLADDTAKDAWECIRIEPEKWQCPPWGDAGGGFWGVAAVKDGEVVWYNDIRTAVSERDQPRATSRAMGQGDLCAAITGGGPGAR